MQNLAEIIANRIKSEGPISVETYWEMCLFHPEFGYYTKKDPLGAAGDFITSPEISQLFGEMVGIWVAEEWVRLGSPSKLHLIECGPGRGTLMSDLLRVSAVVPNFEAALQVHLIEVSPHLRQKQQGVLSGFGMNILWHSDIQTLPYDAPIIFIGNEFLDALPIRQFVRRGGKWHERRIGFDGNFLFLLGEEEKGAELPDADDGAIYESSPQREKIIAQMTARIKKQGGALLMIDYGHCLGGVGDTFQAVKNHQYSNILENQGDADLTSHIDFAHLALDILNQEIPVTVCSQKDFLEKTGILVRAAQLKKNATEKQASDIDSALHRLLDPRQMGELFKVMEARS